MNLQDLQNILSVAVEIAGPVVEPTISERSGGWELQTADSIFRLTLDDGTVSLAVLTAPARLEEARAVFTGTAALAMIPVAIASQI